VKAKARFAALFNRFGIASRSRSSRAFATRGASSDAAGSGAPSPNRKRTLVLPVAGLLALLSVLTLLSTTASADTEFGEEGTDAAKLSSPEGIGVDPTSGDVYVANGFSHRVAKFDADGNSLFAFGWGAATGAEEEQTCTATCHVSPFNHNSVKGALLVSAEDTAVDPVNGDVYVTDGGYNRVEKFDSEGHFIFAFGGDVVAFGPDNSANNEHQKVTVTAEGGTFKLGLDYAYAQAYEEGGQRAETASIPYNATAAEVESALDAISTVGGLGGSVSVTGGPGNATGSNPYEIVFQDNLGGDDVPTLETFGTEGSFGNPPTLTGTNIALTAETLANGGAGEVCKLTAGDVCKTAGDFGNGANGTFDRWAERATLIAVDSVGTVYVGATNRVEKFNSDGSYTDQINVPGGGKTRAIAVDSSGDVYVLSEGVSGVQEFNPLGTLTRTLHPPGNPNLLATDAANDVFIGTEINGGEPTAAYEIAGYNSAGTHYAQLHSPLIKDRGTGEHSFFVNGMAVGDAAGKLYVTNVRFGFQDQISHVVVMPLPEPGPPAITEEQATNVEPSTATLHAFINPKGFDTHYHFEYVNQHAFETEGGFSSPDTHSSTGLGLGLVIQDDPVLAPISGLAPGTKYHFRAVAESECEPVAHPGQICVTNGADETFESLQPVSIRDFTTQAVGPELVTLKAELNPNGSTSNYVIHFGKDTTYSEGSSEGTLPVSNEFEKVTATFTGLKPNTEYHYQLIGENEYGETVTVDQTFTTERSSDEEREAEHCPNTNLREENNSVTLFDCRAYEQTTPLEKQGGEAGGGFGFAPGGEHVLFTSRGAFAGAVTNFIAIQYVANRTATGWTTQATVKRLAPPGTEPIQYQVLSPGLDRWLYAEASGLSLFNAGEAQSSGYYSIGFDDGSAVLHATPTIGLVEGQPRGLFEFMQVNGFSDDLSRFFIPTAARLLLSDPRPGDPEGETRIYEAAGVGGPNPVLNLAAEVPVGLTGSRCVFNGSNNETVGREGRLVSTDGSTLFYTGPVEVTAGANCGEGTPNPLAIFARIGGAAPIQLTSPPASQCSSPHPCATAQAATPRYQGASADGSRLWFTTTQPLIDSDTDSTNDLYLAKLENGDLAELVLASIGEATPNHPTPGSSANLGEEGIDSEGDDNNSGVIRVSEDGSHVAFESPAVLTTHENSLHQSAVKGANNLYLFDAQSGETKFVTELCSGPELSGTEKSGGQLAGSHFVTKANAVADPACPASVSAFVSSFLPTDENDDQLWLPGIGGETRFTPNGRYLLFTSWGRLTPDDTDGVKDLYRYDFQAGKLIRLSFGRNGNDGNGNDNAYPASIGAAVGRSTTDIGSELAEDGARSVSEDGSTVIFETAAPLVSHDTNEAIDVYEWEEQGHGTCDEAGGCIGLVSDGLAPHGAGSGVISSSGRDIAFYSLRNEIPSDTDGVGDIYDARIDGGFHTPHPPSPCGGPEACRPSPGAGPAPPTTGTQTFVGPGNSAKHLHCAKGKVRVIRHGQPRCVAKHHKKKHHKRAHRRAANANRGGNK
jgi:hypothetical protein